MAAKLVNLGFGFGPPRNPRSGPPWVSRAEGEGKREQGRGEGRREKGGEAATAVELLTSIHHCVTKNELEREREREREGEAATYIQDVHSFQNCENRMATVAASGAR